MSARYCTYISPCGQASERKREKEREDIKAAFRQAAQF
jgi:hypothetical protein